MPVIRIADLAQAMIHELAPRYGHDPEKINITHIGTKPGEKLYEELMSHEETRRAVELPLYFSVLPSFRGIYDDIRYNYADLVTDQVTNPSVSAEETPLDLPQVRSFLKQNGLLDHPEEDMTQRYWPGDKEEKK